MEKRNVVEPGRTPEAELNDKQAGWEKKAADKFENKEQKENENGRK
jgi:hypothetical protein